MMKEHTRKIAGLYAIGFSLREIDDLTGIHYNTVRARLRAAGIQLRPRGATEGNNNRYGTPHEVLIRTAFLYEQMGFSTYEIAEQIGCSQSTAHDRLVAHGVKIRPKGESMRMRFARRPMERDNAYLHEHADRPKRPELTDLQILAIATCTYHGKLVLEWPWCDEPNAFGKRTLESLVRRGILKYVDPVFPQDDGTWLIQDNTSHPYYVFDADALGFAEFGTINPERKDSMTIDQATEVMKIARELDMVDANAKYPYGEEKAAESVLVMAQQAWDQGIRGKEVQRILTAAGVLRDETGVDV